MILARFGCCALAALLTLPTLAQDQPTAPTEEAPAAERPPAENPMTDLGEVLRRQFRTALRFQPEEERRTDRPERSARPAGVTVKVEVNINIHSGNIVNPGGPPMGPMRRGDAPPFERDGAAARIRELEEMVQRLQRELAQTRQQPRPAGPPPQAREQIERMRREVEERAERLRREAEERAEAARRRAEEAERQQREERERRRPQSEPQQEEPREDNPDRA